MPDDKGKPPIELVSTRLRAIWSARECVVSAARECATEWQESSVIDEATVDTLIAALERLDEVEEDVTE